MSSQIQENKMGVMPVNRLLISMALPMIVSMLVQAMYNVVDSVFVSWVDEASLTAVSLAAPIQNLMIAVSSGTGVGINALLSRSLGEKNTAEANRAAGNGIFLIFLSYLLFLGFGLFGAGAYFSIQTTDETIMRYGVSYLSICTVCSFALFGQIVFERLLQSTGKTFYTMITQGTGAIINIILDPIFIFVLDMGVAGAAVATVIGQAIAMCLAIMFNRLKNHEITLSARYFRPNKHTIGRIYAVGVPSIVMASISSVMTFSFNMILNTFPKATADTAVAVFGIYFKLQSFVFMPVFGLNNGMVPIIAYNYGARRRERITKTIRLSVIYAVSMMLIGLVIFQCFPQSLLSIFNASDNMLGIGEPALRIISLSFLLAGFNIIFSSVFQALSHGIFSLFVSVGRQLVVLIPVAFLLSLAGNVDHVWWAFPIAEIVAIVLSSCFMARIYRKEIRPMEA